MIKTKMINQKEIAQKSTIYKKRVINILSENLKVSLFWSNLKFLFVALYSRLLLFSKQAMFGMLH